MSTYKNARDSFMFENFGTGGVNNNDLPKSGSDQTVAKTVPKIVDTVHTTVVNTNNIFYLNRYK